MASRTSWARALTAAGLAVTAALVLTSVLRVAADPFGESHDGRNGSIWSAQAEALRTEGPVASRIGARFAGDQEYANHPPLIVVETAAAQAVLGAGRWASRAPAYLGSIVSLVLLWRIARRLGLSSAATAWGLAVASSSHLFTAYLAMLDTPVTSLPFGLLLLDRALAIGGRDEPARSWALVPLAALCGVAGWQSLFLAVVVGAWLLLGARRRDLGALVLGGAVVGLALVLGWQLWVHGSFDNLLEQLRRRSGNELLEEHGGGPVDAWRRQAEFVASLANPVGLLAGAAGLVLLTRDGSWRRTAAVAAGLAVVGYDALLPGGAAFHDYWSYWLVVPVALGTARIAEDLLATPPSLRHARGPVAAVAAVVLLLAPAFALGRSEAADQQREGLHAAALAARAEAPPARSLGAADTRYWAWYEHDRTRPVPAFCDEGPSCIVLVRLDRLPELGYDVEDLDLIDREGPYALVTAAELVTAGRG